MVNKLVLPKDLLLDVIFKDAKSIANDSEDISLPILEPDGTVEPALLYKFHLYASDVAVLFILLMVFGISNEDHLVFCTEVEQDVLVVSLATPCVIFLDFILLLQLNIGLRVLPLVLERRHVGVLVFLALKLRLDQLHLPIGVEIFSDLLALLLEIGHLPALFSGKVALDVDLEQVGEVEGVVLTEVGTWTVDFLYLLFVEEELSKVVFVVDSLAYVGDVFLRDPHYSPFEAKKELLALKVSLWYFFDQIGQPPIDVEISGEWLAVFDTRTFAIDGILWILEPHVIVEYTCEVAAAQFVLTVLAYRAISLFVDAGRTAYPSYGNGRYFFSVQSDQLQFTLSSVRTSVGELIRQVT